MKKARAEISWPLGLVAIIPLALIMLTARSYAVSIRDTWPPEVDELYLPPSSALQRASLGHTELFADLIAARTNVYFGDQMNTKGEQKWLHYYVNTATDLDPYFHPLYLRGSIMLVYGQREFELEDFERAESILKKGTKYFPYDWELWFQIGFNKAFEMDKLVARDGKRYKQFKREGAEALRHSTLLEGVPPHLPNVVATMLTKQGERALAIEHLQRVYAVTSDANARETIKKRLVRLMGEQYRDTFEVEAEKFEQLVKERYPYAPESFSLISGERDNAPFELIPTDE